MHRFILLAAITIIVVSTAAVAGVSQTVTLTSGANSRVDIDTSSGLYNWSVDGADQAVNSWFWYRIGDTGPEASISTLGAPVITPAGTDTVTLKYSGAGFDFSILYLLTGGGAGSGTSDLYENIMVTNHNTTDLNLHVFEYNNFDMGGTAGNDSAHQTSGTMTQTDGGSSATLSFTPSPVVNGVQISQVSSLLDALGNATTTNLAASAPALNNADVEFGYQWNFSVAKNGGSQSLGGDKLISGVPIPEPGSLLPLCVSAMGLAAAYRRRRA